MRRTFALLLLATALPASEPAAVTARPAIEPPLAGWLAAEGLLRPLYGVRGNFLEGSPVAEGVLSAAFSGGIGAAKTEDEILLFTPHGDVFARWEAPAGTALFAFGPEQDTVWMFYCAARELWRWRGGDVARVTLRLFDDEAVLAVGPGAALISGADGLAVRRVGDGPEPVFLLSREGRLWRVGSAGAEPLGDSPAPDGPAVPLGSGWSRMAAYAFDGETFYRLPGAAP